MNKQPKGVSFATRFILSGTQALACAMCLYAVHMGVWIGWIGALSTGLLAIFTIIAPDPKEKA